jgi:hypothetical protein
VIDAYVREEARRNVAAHFPDLRARFEVEVERLELCEAPVDPHAGRKELELPEKDVPVLNAAKRCRCDFLATGDRTHFGALFGKTVGPVTVVSPRMLAERLL